VRDDLVIPPIPARVSGGPIKGPRISKDLALSLMAETLIGPSLVSAGTQEKPHALLSIVPNTCGISM